MIAALDLLERLRAARTDPIAITGDSANGDVERDVIGLEIADVDLLIAAIETAVLDAPIPYLMPQEAVARVSSVSRAAPPRTPAATPSVLASQ